MQEQANFWTVLVPAIAALLGVILGFLAEPVKIYYTNKNRRNQMRRALYAELLNIYFRISDTPKDLSEQDYKNNFGNLLYIPAYEYAKSDPLTFYSIEEASLINGIYATILTLSTMPPNNEGIRMKIGWFDIIARNIDDSVRNRELDADLMYAVGSVYQRKLLKHRLPTVYK